ncbi:hypothetical protein GSY74_02820 [Sulfurovum sp. bin170]|uniref:restriction endonuclease n=1 Tax=Sulfurovum sp. bin170 TaxID=2695268 RepID=UPI0013DFC6BE|nr:restriction endonuclease [Sulfurovum sp. bin170]NEW60205.1 hypothetical protein [Sulfurovum sp. bin170]
MTLFKALKFKMDRFLITLKIKKEQYSWFVVSNDLNQGHAVFRPSSKREITYHQWENNKKEEREISELITTINEFLDVNETSDEYKAFVAKHYKEQGYTVWEYSKDMTNSEELDLVLKKSKNIILVECKNSSKNIDMEQILNFEAQADKFLGENQIFKNYCIKLRYTMASLLLEEEAYDYVKSHSDRIDYDIIKLTTPKP